MSSPLWFGVWFAAIGLGCRALLRGAPRAAHEEQQRLARVIGHQVPQAPTPVHERFVARRRGQVLGWALGAVPFVVVQGAALLLDLDESSGGTLMLLPVGMAVGSGLGVAASHHHAGGRRQASLTPRRLTGLVTPVEVACAWLVLLLPAVCLAVGVWLWAIGAGTRAALLAVGGSLLALAAWGAAGSLVRRVVGAALPAPTREVLAWNEILRAASVRELVAAQVIATAALAVVPTTTALFESSHPVRAFTLALLACAAPLVCFAASVIDRRFSWLRSHAGREALA